MTRPVVGLDLSLTSTGIAVHGAIPDWAGTIKSKGAKTDTWVQRWRRIGDLTTRVNNAIPEDALVVVEAPSYGSNTGSAHDRAGLWWFVYDLVLSAGRRGVLPIPPTVRAKYATGKGNAGKDAVLAAAVRRYAGIEIDDNNVADAVVLMAIGCRLLGEPIDDPMPAANLAALDKLPALEPVTARP